jgi:hypothetical protein
MATTLSPFMGFWACPQLQPVGLDGTGSGNSYSNSVRDGLGMAMIRNFCLIFSFFFHFEIGHCAFAPPVPSNTSFPLFVGQRQNENGETSICFCQLFCCFDFV